MTHAVPPKAGPRAFLHRLRHGDEIAHLITLVFAAGILLITSMLVYELWVNSHLSRAKFGWMFFWTRTWDPIFDNFGAAPFIYGTLVTSVVSLVIAVPLGLAAAIFLAELAPRKISDSDFFSDRPAGRRSQRHLRIAGNFHRRAADAHHDRAGSESDLGFPPLFFKGPNYGVGLSTAGIVLAIMVVPFIISVSREVLLTVPREQREAALALGATRWEATWKVGGAVGADRHSGLGISGAGARSGRNHGRHDGDRQRPENQRVASSRPATPSPRSSPTNSPKRPAICT